MTRPRHIPLFPLDVVLVPGMPLPLHIFEPRYKEMIRRCLEERLEFGLVFAQREGMSPVGCTAEIVRVVREYPDGRMDILTAGVAVFTVLEVHEEKAYLEATVEYRADEPPAPSEDAAEIGRLFAQAQALLRGGVSARLAPDSTVPLSYQVVSALPLEHEFKQKLLEMESEPERRAELLHYLQTWLPQLGHANRVRQKAGGNGRGLT